VLKCWNWLILFKYKFGMLADWLELGDSNFLSRRVNIQFRVRIQYLPSWYWNRPLVWFQKKFINICFLNRYFHYIRYVLVFTLILGCDATRIATLSASKPLQKPLFLDVLFVMYFTFLNCTNLDPANLVIQTFKTNLTRCVA
jgi:hypothetical protein